MSEASLIDSTLYKYFVQGRQIGNSSPTRDPDFRINLFPTGSESPPPDIDKS